MTAARVERWEVRTLALLGPAVRHYTVAGVPLGGLLFLIPAGWEPFGTTGANASILLLRRLVTEPVPPGTPDEFVITPVEVER